jgi:hypothetical protein
MADIRIREKCNTLISIVKNKVYGFGRVLNNIYVYPMKNLSALISI